MLSRSAALRSLADDHFDVVVVGGGITGAGVALDAASRGYSVALVERNDYASGTSSRSSKLVHGGLRYLQNFDLGLVREALVERQLMVALAPHLVTPLPLVIAGFDGQPPDRLMGAALNLYDVMTLERRRGRRHRRGRARSDDPAHDEIPANWSPERHRTISGDEVARRLPAIAHRDPTGGYLFYDCQTDDSRLVLTVLAEAERYGAVCANRLNVSSLVERSGRAVGVNVEDAISGATFAIRADTVVNATGVWADRLRPQELYDEAEVPRISPSRGTHVTFRYDDIPIKDGAIVPVDDGRFLFALPWLGRTLIGTTDVDHDGDLVSVHPSASDLTYILNATNAYFGTDLSEDDMTGAYAGVRPLISTGDPRKSVDISRKAELYETSSGMITITGGKLTTWRRMAKMTVDRIVERDALDSPCRTHEIALGQQVDPADLPRVEGVDADAYAALAARYGHVARDVLSIASERGAYAQPVIEGLPDLLAEVIYAVRTEQAVGLGDVLLRRTRLGLLAARELEPGSDVLARVAAALATERGWDATQVSTEISTWGREARREGIAPTR